VPDVARWVTDYDLTSWVASFITGALPRTRATM
jgi:hypothetical protein